MHVLARLIACAAASTAVLALAVPAHARTAPCYDPPVAAGVAEPFVEPECPYCAGRRGITFASRRGDPVRAVASGVVSFRGVVAGTTYLVVAHDDGLLATYGRIERTWLRVGQRVSAGQRVAVAGEVPLYFGLRRAGRYIDPQPLLGIRRYPVRLVPTAGGGGRPPGQGDLVCPLVPRSR